MQRNTSAPIGSLKPSSSSSMETWRSIFDGSNRSLDRLVHRRRRSRHQPQHHQHQHQHPHDSSHQTTASQAPSRKGSLSLAPQRQQHDDVPSASRSRRPSSITIHVITADINEVILHSRLHSHGQGHDHSHKPNPNSSNTDNAACNPSPGNPETTKHANTSWLAEIRGRLQRSRRSSLQTKARDTSSALLPRQISIEGDRTTKGLAQQPTTTAQATTTGAKPKKISRKSPLRVGLEQWGESKPLFAYPEPSTSVVTSLQPERSTLVTPTRSPPPPPHFTTTQDGNQLLSLRRESRRGSCTTPASPMLFPGISNGGGNGGGVGGGRTTRQPSITTPNLKIVPSSFTPIALQPITPKNGLTVPSLRLGPASSSTLMVSSNAFAATTTTTTTTTTSTTPLEPTLHSSHFFHLVYGDGKQLPAAGSECQTTAANSASDLPGLLRDEANSATVPPLPFGLGFGGGVGGGGGGYNNTTAAGGMGLGKPPTVPAGIGAKKRPPRPMMHRKAISTSELLGTSEQVHAKPGHSYFCADEHLSQLRKSMFQDPLKQWAKGLFGGDFSTATMTTTAATSTESKLSKLKKLTRSRSAVENYATSESTIASATTTTGGGSGSGGQTLTATTPAIPMSPPTNSTFKSEPYLSSLPRPERKLSTWSVKETSAVVASSTVTLSSEEKAITEELKRKLGLTEIEGLINQYAIIKNIGEGSFGKVLLVYHMEEDRYYACKSISKKRLRKKGLWKRGPPRKKELAREVPVTTVAATATATTAPNDTIPMKTTASPLPNLTSPLPAGTHKEPLRDEPAPKQPPSVPVNTDYMDLIRREIAILKKLSKHPHISTLIEVLDDEKTDSLYMVFELCEYGPIMRLKLNEEVSPFSEELARRYFRDVVHGLEYLHHLHIMHRDIKPENILLNAANHAVVGDFSISYCSSSSMGKNKSHENNNNNNNNTTTNSQLLFQDSRLTGNDVLTPMFTPPELLAPPAQRQEQQQQQDGSAASSSSNQNTACYQPASDIWSLGVTLYCFVHGRVPFTNCGGDRSTTVTSTTTTTTPTTATPAAATTYDELYAMIQRAPIAPLLNPELSEDLKDLLLRLLDRDPTRRISLKAIKLHPWTTQQGAQPMLSTETNCQPRDDPEVRDDVISEEDLRRAVRPARAMWERLRDKWKSSQQVRTPTTATAATVATSTTTKQ